MDNPGDSPKATRKRVRWFVGGSLFVVGVVAFWPLKGYRIDSEKFAASLGSSPFEFHASVPGKTSDVGGKSAAFSLNEWKTRRVAREWYEGQLDAKRPILAWIEMDGQGPDRCAYGRRDRTSTYSTETILAIFWRNNLTCSVVFDAHNVPDGMTPESLIRDCRRTILDGIDREIPGVTSFYNPPARELWFGQVRPFFCKRFPKWVLPLGPYLDPPAP